MLHELLLVRFVPQLFVPVVRAKGPVTAIAMALLDPLPLLRIRVWAALVVPTTWFPNANEVGFTLIATPVPVSGTVNVPAGLPLLLFTALVRMVRVPLFAPSDVGRKVTPMLQLPPPATLVPQLFATVVFRAKLPEVEILVIAIAELPLFESVTVLMALVTLVAWFPKASDVGFTLPVGGRRPVPVNATVRLELAGSFNPEIVRLPV